MQKVLEQYLRSISKQLKRRNRKGRDNFTPNENKAIEFYGRAVQQLKTLIDAPTPAWVGLTFSKPRRTR
jgi:hypothetical protein